MGMGISGFTATYFAYVPILGPTEVQEMISLIESFTGNNIY